MKNIKGTSIEQTLTATMCEGTPWRVVTLAYSDGAVHMRLEATEPAIASIGLDGPSTMIDRLSIAGFKREVHIAKLEAEIRILKAKLEGVMISNSALPLETRRALRP